MLIWCLWDREVLLSPFFPWESWGLDRVQVSHRTLKVGRIRGRSEPKSPSRILEHTLGPEHPRQSVKPGLWAKTEGPACGCLLRFSPLLKDFLTFLEIFLFEMKSVFQMLTVKTHTHIVSFCMFLFHTHNTLTHTHTHTHTWVNPVWGPTKHICSLDSACRLW